MSFCRLLCSVWDDTCAGKNNAGKNNALYNTAATSCLISSSVVCGIRFFMMMDVTDLQFLVL